MYTSEFHNAEETKKVLEKGAPGTLHKWYQKKEKGPAHHTGDNTMKKPTLRQKMNQLEVSINELTKIVNDGFKQVNNRIDRIENRLDYNGLKKLPNNR
ncbi:MAG: hypothetical protein MJ213_00480 [Bacilli bacterium]|nr:hypothetical protein [Bacilli bacterium]